jgi:hypothetical protein
MAICYEEPRPLMILSIVVSVAGWRWSNDRAIARVVGALPAPAHFQGHRLSLSACLRAL